MPLRELRIFCFFLTALVSTILVVLYLDEWLNDYYKIEAYFSLIPWFCFDFVMLYISAVIIIRLLLEREYFSAVIAFIKHFLLWIPWIAFHIMLVLKYALPEWKIPYVIVFIPMFISHICFIFVLWSDRIIASWFKRFYSQGRDIFRDEKGDNEPVAMKLD